MKKKKKKKEKEKLYKWFFLRLLIIHMLIIRISNSKKEKVLKKTKFIFIKKVTPLLYFFHVKMAGCNTIEAFYTVVIFSCEYLLVDIITSYSFNKPLNSGD